MNLLDDISSAIQLKFKISGSKLSESSHSSSCKEITLQGRGRYLIYKFDANPDKLFPFFQSNRDVLKLCDYIVFYKSFKNKYFVFLCELKSKSTGGSKKQIQSGLYFSEFILKTVMKIRNEEYSASNFVFRGLLFSTKIYKSTTNVNKFQFEKYPNSSFDFVHLRCGLKYDLDSFCN